MMPLQQVRETKDSSVDTDRMESASLNPELKTIINILQDCKKGCQSDYIQILHSISKLILEPAILHRQIKDFQICASFLDEEFEPLIKAVLRVDWSSHGPQLLKDYCHFVTHLVSAHSVYLCPVLNMLVKHIVPSDQLLVLPRLTSDVARRGIGASDRLKYEWVHETLGDLTNIAPATSKYLLAILTDSFPWIKKPSYVTNGYVENLLAIIGYIPELQVKVLELILHRMTELDVNSPKEDILEAESTTGCLDGMQFDMDSVEGGLGNNDFVQEFGQEKKPVMKHEMANTLDCLMHTMMMYIRDSCYVNDEFQLDKARMLHRYLLQVFDKVILPVHSSSYVQYLMFYFCSFKKAIVDSFLEYLWKRFTNPNTPLILRQSTAGYIASFVSRANYLPLGTVTACMDLLTTWLQSYIDKQENKTRMEQDIAVHGPFYSLCQTLFYIFVFRHRQLFEVNQGLHYVMGLNIERIVTCRLNPLRFCLPSVVNIFVTLTRKYQIAYCYTILERNSRSLNQFTKHHSNGSVSQITMANSLESSFPFDPYILTRSGHFVQSLYRQWEGCKPIGTSTTSTTSKRVQEEDEFIQYEQWDKDLSLGSTPTIMTCISSGFRS